MTTTDFAKKDHPLLIRGHEYYKWSLLGAWMILLLNVLDMITTITALRLGADEVNPIAAFLMQYHLIWPLKLFLCSAPLVTLIHQKVSSILFGTVVWWIAGWYTCVVTINSMSIVRHLWT